MTLSLVEESQSRAPTRDSVADALGVETDVITRLFADDRALLTAAVEQALIILMDTCTKAVVRVDPRNPMAQFIALGDAYLDWADRHRAQFRLMSDQRLLEVMNIPNLRRYVVSVTDLMTRMLTRAKSEGLLHPKEDIAVLVLSARSYAYGLARMIVEDQTRDSMLGEDPVGTAKMLTRDFILRVARSSQPLPA
nr:WHG domain-containing protein [Paracoccus saliphilus]